jgi:hypothetical protein
MIRRGFWLAVGAATGIYAYRRVSAAGRRLSASLNPGESKQAAQLVRQGRVTAVKATRETYRFTRDVREGMDLYTARHAELADSTLESKTHEPKDGR